MMQAIPRHPKHSDLARFKAGYCRQSGERLNAFVAFGAERTFGKGASFAPPA
jgi:hypothetical protein